MSKSFAEELGYPVSDIYAYREDLNESIFLITRSVMFGSVPDPTADFLYDYSDQVVGCAVSGDTVWGENFGGAGKEIKRKYDIPLVHIFERSGFPQDVEKVRLWIENYIKQNKKGVIE